jgi:hypothetical protein
MSSQQTSLLAVHTIELDYIQQLRFVELTESARDSYCERSVRRNNTMEHRTSPVFIGGLVSRCCRNHFFSKAYLHVGSASARDGEEACH